MFLLYSVCHKFTIILDLWALLYNLLSWLMHLVYVFFPTCSSIFIHGVFSLLLQFSIRLMQQLTSTFWQSIFADYEQPFAISYVTTSLWIVYLPIALLKDWLLSFLHRYNSKRGDLSVVGQSSVELQKNEVNIASELEPQGELSCKNCTVDVYSKDEGTPLVAVHIGKENTLKKDRKFTAKEVAAFGFCVAPIWFLTEVRYWFHDF